MKILDLISAQWAMLPEKVNGLLDVISSHNQGGKLDLKAMEKALLDFTQDDNKDFDNEQDDVAIIPIQGVLMKRPTAFERIILGAASMDDIRNNIEMALNDYSVNSIILYIDSPGGTVDGTKELSDFIYESRNKKKIIAYSDGTIASAAYWIASAAEKIYISSETVNVGSIGVITTHVDVSAFNEGQGVKITDIYSGDFKAAGSENAPLDDKSTAYIQDRVDYLYAVFINDVARNRQQSTSFVVDKMANGRVFIGGNSIKNNLVDGVSTFQNLKQELTSMNKSEFLAKHEDLYKEIRADIENEMSEKFNAEKSDIEIKALESERKRISDIQAISLPGYEKIIDEGIKSGILAADVSIKIIEAQKENLKIKAEEFDNDGSEVLPEVEPIEPEDEKDFLETVKELAKEKNISITQARASVIKSNPAAYDKFLKGAK